MAVTIAGLLLACLVLAGLAAGAGRRAARRQRCATPARLTSGPRHPDWPLPPRR